MKNGSRGFTLIELMIALVVIGILLALGIVQYRDMLNKSQDATAKGNLGVIRSAIRVYYGDTGIYPTDDLSILVTPNNYLKEIPPLKTVAHLAETRVVTVETLPTEIATWSYNNNDSAGVYGRLAVGCLHQDMRGAVWTSY